MWENYRSVYHGHMYLGSACKELSDMEGGKISLLEKRFPSSALQNCKPKHKLIVGHFPIIATLQHVIIYITQWPKPSFVMNQQVPQKMKFCCSSCNSSHSGSLPKTWAGQVWPSLSSTPQGTILPHPRLIVLLFGITLDKYTLTGPNPPFTFFSTFCTGEQVLILKNRCKSLQGPRRDPDPMMCNRDAASPLEKILVLNRAYS